MAWHTKNIRKGMLGSSNVFMCLWLVVLLVLSSGELRSEGCQVQLSKTWSHKVCVKHGTCNTPCRAEGYDNGSCYFLNQCICARNCVSPAPEALVLERWNKIV